MRTRQVKKDGTICVDPCRTSKRQLPICGRRRRGVLGCILPSRRGARALQQDRERAALEGRMRGKVDADDPPTVLRERVEALLQIGEAVVLVAEGDRLYAIFHEDPPWHDRSIWGGRRSRQ